MMLCRCYVGEPSSTTVPIHSQKSFQRSLLCTPVPCVLFFSLAGDCPPAPFLMYAPSSSPQVGAQRYLIPSSVQPGAALHLLECIPILPCTDLTRSGISTEPICTWFHPYAQLLSYLIPTQSSSGKGLWVEWILPILDHPLLF